MTRVLCFFLVISIFSPQWCEISYGDDSLRTGRESLIDKYHKIEKELGKSPFDIPFYGKKKKSRGVESCQAVAILLFIPLL